MKKFEGILICSDVDGTYNSTGDKSAIPVNNEAAKYFTDNGGKFTFSTGRPAGFIRRDIIFPVINAPVCLYNGGMIYDFENESILFEERFKITVQEFITAMYDCKDVIKKFYIFDNCDKDYIFFPDFDSVTEAERLLKPIKVICVCKDIQSADEFKAFAEKQEIFKNFNIAKSDNVTVEFNDINATKGNGLKFIKNYLGNIHTAIGVGDNENDITLIQDADIGVAVGNAPEKVKKFADMIVKPCDEFAIKDLIEILDKKYNECILVKNIK